MSTPTVYLDNTQVSATHDIVEGWTFTRKATVSNIPYPPIPSGLGTTLPYFVNNYNPNVGSYTQVTDGPSIVEYALWYLQATLDNNSGGGIIGTVGNSYLMPPNAWNPGPTFPGYSPGDSPIGAGYIRNVPLYLKSFAVESVSPGGPTGYVVSFRITYKGYPAFLCEFDSSLTSDSTNEDVNGNPIFLAFHYPAIWAANPQNQNTRVVQSSVFQRQLPQTSFTFRFAITSGPGGTAWTEATYLSSFEGCINNDWYTIGHITASAHQLLCTKVSAQSKDGGTYYEMTMTFVYAPDPSNRPQQGWDKYLIFIDPQLGVPPPGIQSGTSGEAYIQIYPAVTFPTFNPYPM